MLVFTFSYLVGVSAEMFMGQPISTNAVVFIAINGLIAAALWWSTKAVDSVNAKCLKGLRQLQFALLGVAVGSAVVWAHQQTFESQGAVAHGKGYWIGQFIGLPSSSEYGSRWRFKAHQACSLETPNTQQPCTADYATSIERQGLINDIVLELTLPQAEGASLPFGPGSGQVWALPLRVRSALKADQSLDYQIWLRRENIVGKANLLPALPSSYLMQRATVDSARFSMRDFLLKAHAQSKWSSNSTVIGLLLAITLGDRSLFDRDDWALFTQTGTSHLVAISGFHLSLVFAVIYWVSFQVASSMPVLFRILLPQYVGFICGALGATGYAALAGFALPTQRALVMILVVCLVRGFGVIKGWWVPLLLAVCLILAWQPYAIASASLWMSVYAVAIILWVTVGRLGKASVWKSMLYIQLAIGLGMVPISLFYFQQFSLSGLIINVFAIPVIAWLILPLSLVYLVTGLVLPGIIDWLQPALYGVCSWFIRMLEWGANWPLSVWVMPQIDIWMLLAGIIGVALLLTPKGFPLKALGFVFVIPLFAGHLIPPQIDQVKLAVVGNRKSFSIVTFSSRESGEDDWLILDPLPGFDWQEAQQLKRLFSLKGLPDDSMKGFEPNLVYQWFIQTWALTHAIQSQANLLSSQLAPADFQDLCRIQSRYSLGSLVIQSIQLNLNTNQKKGGEDCALAMTFKGRSWLLLYSIEPEQQLRLLDALENTEPFDVIVLDNPQITGALLNRFSSAEYVVRTRDELPVDIQMRFQARQLHYLLIDSSDMVFARAESRISAQKQANQPYLIREREFSIRKYSG